ncbi:Oidioi.mRNA.OKI2018_I69.XSR.g15962.t1.cds [Oikopleura dioica]|uniref:Oidioi.mRNA.OKI2018_I69.XSR.g15962.t1.cds n=1 Tax=Oikopleura dioica TaxID=34765 RepID=A0ABN7SLV8_OIKDI|nr:Oidioi.mRNA.OKI2018_I69.XSR.g15962.t1.cds [Oikopleura dioica]
MEEVSGIEETLLDSSKKQELDEDGTAFSARHKRETFQKFWTKDKTEALLRILAAQAEQGDVDHGKAAKLLSAELQLEHELKADQVVDRISLLVSSFKREIEKEERNGLPSSWRWKKQMKRLSEKLKRNQTESESLEPPEKKLFSGGQREVKIASGTDENAESSGGKGERERFIDASQVDASLFDLDKKQTSTYPSANGSLPGSERRGRMPDAHVEILLDCYKFVLQNRMLSSGRLGKGSFQEVADEMNRRCGLDGDGTYEREQLAAKLQNLKTQFRNRKQAVDDGRESGSLWKWYQTMDDLSSAELNLRESFDGATSRLNSTYQNSPLSASQEDEPSYSRDERFELNYDNSDTTPSRKEKRELTREELEHSFGDLAVLLFDKDGCGKSDESESDSSRISDQLNSMRSTAIKLLTGFSAVLSHVETE